MKLTERLELIRAGYKRKEIDAMILAEENEERIEDTSHEPITPKTDEEEKAVEIKEDNQPPLPDQTEEKEDFEKLYKEALEKITEKENQIKRMQERNIQMDLSGGTMDIDKERQESLNALLF